MVVAIKVTGHLKSTGIHTLVLYYEFLLSSLVPPTLKFVTLQDWLTLNTDRD